MSTILAGDIVDRAALLLFDETGVRWTPTELLGYLSDAQREIVKLDPSANSRNDVVQLEPGTRQSIPAHGMTLIKCIRMMGTDGQTPGRAVRQIDAETIDATRPNWHTEAPAAEAKHWMFDNRDPAHFYVTPPQPDPAHHMEILYAATPGEVSAVGDVIELGDHYQTPILYFILARALMKDTSTQNPQKAMGYYEMFRSVVDGRQVAADALQPDQMPSRINR